MSVYQNNSGVDLELERNDGLPFKVPASGTMRSKVVTGISPSNGESPVILDSHYPHIDGDLSGGLIIGETSYGFVMGESSEVSVGGGTLTLNRATGVFTFTTGGDLPSALEIKISYDASYFRGPKRWAANDLAELTLVNDSVDDEYTIVNELVEDDDIDDVLYVSGSEGASKRTLIPVKNDGTFDCSMSKVYQYREVLNYYEDAENPTAVTRTQIGYVRG